LAGARGPLLFSFLLILAALFLSTEKRLNHYKLIGYLLPVVLGLVVFAVLLLQRMMILLLWWKDH
jgi:hydrogenase-4 membrane subunit HyfE